MFFASFGRWMSNDGAIQHFAARNAEHGLECPVDEKIFARFRVLHDHRNRNVLDDRIQKFPGFVQLLLGAPLFGDVDMGRDPAAIGHRPVADGIDVAVAQHVLDVIRLPLGDFVEPGLDILLGVLRRFSGADPRFEYRAQRRAGLDLLGTETVHLAVTLIADDQALLAIEHAQAVRHVLERGMQQEIRLLERLLGTPQLGGGRQDMRLLRGAENHDDQHDERQNASGHDVFVAGRVGLPKNIRFRPSRPRRSAEFPRPSGRTSVGLTPSNLPGFRRLFQ